MSTPWWQAPITVFDFESTGIDTETCRIVQAAVVKVGPVGVMDSWQAIVAPGVPIPAEATAVHGITDERAQVEGIVPSLAIEHVLTRIQRAWDRGQGVCAMNCTYDLSLLDRESRRHTGSGLDGVGPMLDPLVLDRWLDKYRKGSRKLVDLAAHYGVKCTDAHDAMGDVLTTARVLWVMARRFRALADATLADLQGMQERAHKAWATNYQEYLRTKADPLQPDAVVSREWPLRSRKLEVAR